MLENNLYQNLITAFDAENFKNIGYQVIDILTEYLNNLKHDRIKTVLPNIKPEDILKHWPGDFPKEPQNNWQEKVQKIIKQSNHLHHKNYIGHQCTSPVPFSALMELIGVFLNNGTAIYEMGPVNVAMEKRVINWMSEMIGFPTDADGIFTSGGTLGNLTALLAARQAKSDFNVWKQGLPAPHKYKIIVSQQSHYSIKRAVCIMGLGEDSVITVPVNHNYKMAQEEVVKKYKEVVEKGGKVLAVVGNACSTATGTYDNLAELGQFCRQNSIWFHVDAAHGASALLSDKYRNLLAGIDLADSVVWDAHKMLLMPALTTAVIFRQGSDSYQAFSQKASYLFEKDSKEEWYNFAHRTMECTKKMMGMKLYMSLAILGTDFFRNYIEYTYEVTAEFARLLKKDPDFDSPVFPEANIICFRYLGKKNQDKESINTLQRQIRQNLLKSEQFYIVQTELNGNVYLRCTIINPLTKIEDLKALMESIRLTE